VATHASWGFEDRDACLRIPESDAKNLRIEYRLAGADANPYLVLAAILVGLEHGLEAGKEPIPPLNEDRNSGIDFPVEMLEAVRAMQHQPQLREGLGRSSSMCIARTNVRITWRSCRKSVPGNIAGICDAWVLRWHPASTPTAIAP
jgi:glutamine synthetase